MMASTSTAPSTPERKVGMGSGRSFTVPARLADISRSKSAPLEGAGDAIETLFHHPDAAVFKFNTTRSSLPASNSTSKEQGLSWTSPRETRVAVGPLEVYRVPESVSFLKSGDLLHAIMPRSQCWCVDGVSKFAMRVMHETYYRIELPAQTQEDMESIEEFKKVLGTVMHYERSACPFAREHAAELPEMEDISERKMSKVGIQWLHDRKTLRRSQAPNESISEIAVSRSRLRSVTGARSDEPAKTTALDDPFQSTGKRAVTVPSLLSSTDASRYQQQSSHSAGDSKNTVLQAIPTDMPPSPPYSSTEQDMGDEQIEEESLGENLQTEQEPHVDSDALVRRNQPQSEGTEEIATVSSAQPESCEETIESEQKKHHEPSGESTSEASTTIRTPRTTSTRTPDSDDPFAAIQARILARRSIGGTTSFYPSNTREGTSASTTSVSSASTMSSSRSHVTQMANQNLATALVRKACHVFLGPPAHLVLMMLRIAARFTNGTFGKLLHVESSGTNHRIPGSFSVSEDAFGEGVSDEEDDFGVPLHSPVRVAASRGLRERRARDVTALMD